MAKTLDEKWEQVDTARMDSAVREIRMSENLRFFMRSLLAAFGADLTPEGDNALGTARAIGRHSAAMDIRATLLTYDPMLYPDLIVEDLKEQAQRTKDAENEDD